MWTSFADTTGWAGLFTAPILLVVGILLIANAIGFIVLAVRLKKYVLYLMGALITLLPVIGTGAYIVVGTSLQQQAKERAEIPISLSQARALVSTCQIETIMRHNGGSMQLNAYVPVLPGMRSSRETRTFDVKYYDELFQLARRKDVEDRCGFVPTYDIERPRQPETKKWITQAEAEAILGKCLWNTRFYPASLYLTDTDFPPGTNRIGILLQQRLSVWNDDTESTITLSGVDDQTRSTLLDKQKACSSY